MTPLAWMALIGIVGAVLYGLGRLALMLIREGGGAQARADRAEADLTVAKKQAEIMADDRSEEDAATRLDDGSF
jgi:hypothetical protein